VAGRVASSLYLPVGALGAVLLFLFAVKLLGTATSAAAPALERAFFLVLVSDASALGLGWLGAYVLGNGSVVAALSLSLYTVDVVAPPQLFLMVSGSRLGAAAIVVVIGALDYAQKEHYSLQESVRMGLLTFLLTLSIYLPTTVLGYVALPHVLATFRAVGRQRSLGLRPLPVVDAAAAAVTTSLGPTLSFLLAVTALLGSLKLFDRLLANVDTATLSRRFFVHLERVWLSFAIGLLVTTVTTSVAFSLGVIVPLYNRGYVERDELVPYVLGANLGTLLDTLMVAVVLGSRVGTAVVVVLMAVATLVTLAALVAIDDYRRLVVAADDRLAEDRLAFVGFVLALVVVPLALGVVPLALG
jgi:sodium-dependent phosphate cotransporter